MNPSRHDLQEREGRPREIRLARSVRGRTVRNGSGRDEVLRQESQLNGLTDELSDIPDLETMHQVEAVHLDSPYADPKLLRNLPIRQTLYDERQHLLLPRRHGTRGARGPYFPSHPGDLPSTHFSAFQRTR
jgi:hypothetical protein